jgi:hypothetical protein
LVVLHRLNPALDQPVADGVRQRHVQIVDRRPLGRPALYKKEIVQKRLRQRLDAQRRPLSLVRSRRVCA